MYVYYYRTYKKAVSLVFKFNALLDFGVFAFLSFSLGPAGDCPCRH
jgi:hypothetical protein